MKKMSRLLLIASIAATISTCLCARNITIEGGGGTEIAMTGKVMVGVLVRDSADTGAKIQYHSADTGVTVFYQPTDFSDVRKSTRTDSFGNYQFSIQKSGTYTISYEKDYCITVSKTFELDSFETIHIDTVRLQEIPVPTFFTPIYDSIQGIITLKWDSVASNDQWYEIDIFNSINDTLDYDVKKRKTSFYSDTLFKDIGDVNNEIEKKYRVKISLPDGSTGRWGEPYPITKKRPKVPPIPKCSLTNIYGTREVTVNYSFPQLWWIDSIFIFRSIKNIDTLIRVASLPLTNNRSWIDAIKAFPSSITDSFLQVTYLLQTKSRDSILSNFSLPETIKVVQYSIHKPAIQWVDMPDTIYDQGIQIPITPLPSPVPQDTLEYRLLITGTDSTKSADSTDWYIDLPIDAKFKKAGKYFISCQARSRHFPTLLSPLSDAFAIIVK
jgi:hypothetical protein